MRGGVRPGTCTVSGSIAIGRLRSTAHCMHADEGKPDCPAAKAVTCVLSRT
jgi:hypothetical protein